MTVTEPLSPRASQIKAVPCVWDCSLLPRAHKHSGLNSLTLQATVATSALCQAQCQSGCASLAFPHSPSAPSVPLTLPTS